MIISTAIVAHTSRRIQAAELAQTVNGQIFMDNGELGCEANHTRAWEWHAGRAHTVDWALTLEDDALPVHGFGSQVLAALAVAPAPIVSFYLGTDERHYWQAGIRAALTAATPGTSWLLSGALLHAVAVAVRSDLLPLSIGPGLAVDTALGNWAKKHDHLIAYSVPSLVDHADTEPIVTQRFGPSSQRLAARRAHITGTRPRWTNCAIQIGH